MNTVARAALSIIAYHLLRVACEFVYFEQCVGPWKSVWAMGSPSCQALRYVSDTSTKGLLSTSFIVGNFLLAV